MPKLALDAQFAALLRCSPAAVGLADLRLAVISPFVDRGHGTERARAELLERLARRYHCEIHLYSYSVYDSFDLVARWADRVILVPSEPKSKLNSWLHPLPNSAGVLMFGIKD